MTEKSFGEALRELMEDRGLTFRAVVDLTAQRTGKPALTYSHLSQVARGHVPVTKGTIEAVAAALGLRPTFFLEYRLALVREVFDERTAPEPLAGRLRDLVQLLEEADDTADDLRARLAPVLAEYEEEGATIPELVRPHLDSSGDRTRSRATGAKAARRSS